MADRNLKGGITEAEAQRLAASVERIDQHVERARDWDAARRNRPAYRTFLPVMTVAEAREHAPSIGNLCDFEVTGRLPAGTEAYLVVEGRRVAFLTDLAG